ncbi:hypothetical protein GGP91_001823 [Salinibacter ruber]|nr:DUF4293 family protein [Salinibacter ruber]CBH24801.1 Conserved hypothetical protein, membrane [Salinibacter ruber M8]MCS3636359.1 hypothetical protein [Salinibacter ruber]MCS3674662.1 hypothetical protein [Salinibacter ruber]MCS3683208.1 hypothetical protein [Salinibacter ruber]MCS3701693.1 hypothetical protein [Salinibacter ruber]
MPDLTAMIQRIQTVYLLLGALALAATGLFEVPWSDPAAQRYAWFVPSVAGLVVGTAATALGAIFLYERRKTQRTVVYGLQVLTIVLAGVLYGGLYTTGTLTFTDPTGILWSRTIVLLLPMVAYVLFRLARRGIESDIELVESMDRIR